MKTFLQLFCALCISNFYLESSLASDTNPPPRLTVELRDGSRVIGDDVEKYFKFHSASLGDLKFEVKDIRSVECVSSNSAKLTTVNGDSLTVSFVDSEFSIKTSFGKVNLQVDSVRKFSVSAGGTGAHPPGLVALWSGEGGGNDLVGGNNAVLIGNVTFEDGKVGRAFSLDGSSSYLTVPASPSLDVGTGDGLTVTAWIKPSVLNATPGHGGPILEWDSSSSDGVQLWAQGGNNLFANIKDTSGNTHTLQTSNGALNTETFQFVAVTYDKNSGVVAIYVNGVAVASQNFGSFTPQTTYPINIGRRTGQPVGDGDTYGGLIDELSIYNRALSAEEIQAICTEQNNGEPLPPPPPSPRVMPGIFRQNVFGGGSIISD